MRYSGLLASAACFALVLAGGTDAQSRNSRQAPAEVPPSSYTGAQYIDSRGCVFIRAGVDGSVLWVPRLTRQRRQVCGQTPTRVAGASSTAPARSAQVEQITIPQTATATPEPAPAPTVRPPTRTVQPVAQPRPVPVVRQTVRTAATTATPRPAPQSQPVSITPRPAPTAVARTVQPRVVAPAPQSVAATTQTQVYVQPQPQPVPPHSTGTGRVVCPGRSTISQYYLSLSGADVRCGPQAVGSNTARVTQMPQTAVPVRRAGVATVTTGTPIRSARVLPSHVAENRRVIGAAPRVPQGYRKAWEDDRLNPHRAEGTIAGYAQMNLVWTSTVPRRLIDRRTGRDVTAQMPLVYPYTDAATQRRELGQVTLMTRNGQLVKRIQRNSSARAAANTTSTRAFSQPSRAQTAAQPVRQPVQRAAITTPQPAAVGRFYVQVGTFGQARNAQNTVSRLGALGFPVRTSRIQRQGRGYDLVMAGPFAGHSAAQNALSRVRGLGFADAYIRR